MASQHSDVPTLTAFIKTLTNPQLKDLLRYEGLQVSGVKAALQFRIIHRWFHPPKDPPRLQFTPSLYCFHSPTFVFTMKHQGIVHADSYN
jgi:hypothetical protein